MPSKNQTIELSNPNYVQVIKDSYSSYGGNQMWFQGESKCSTDYVLRSYGCGTIAVSDIFLYLAMQNEAMQTSITSAVLQGRKTVKYDDYDLYVRKINKYYTHTRRIIAVLGPKIASAINSYSRDYGLGLKAAWRWKLTYYDMLDIMEEMLSMDIPIILSIGPNWPKLWGEKGVSFYELKEIDYHDANTGTDNKNKPYYYHAVKQAVNSHYVAVTGIIKDDIAGTIMLRISSWGKMYYLNYEEYRDYIDTVSNTWTSSLAHVQKKD